MNDRRRARHHDQAAVRLRRERSDGALDFAGIARIDWDQLDPERLRQRLDGGELAHGGHQCGIPEDCDSGRARGDLI
jgi:hypothetical protein